MAFKKPAEAQDKHLPSEDGSTGIEFCTVRENTRIVTLEELRNTQEGLRHSWSDILSAEDDSSPEEPDQLSFVVINHHYEIIDRYAEGSPVIDDSTGITEIPEKFALRGGQSGTIDSMVGTERWGALTIEAGFGTKGTPHHRNAASVFCNPQRGVHAVTYVRNHPAISNNIIKTIYNKLETPLDGNPSCESHLVDNALLVSHTTVDPPSVHLNHAASYLDRIYKEKKNVEFEKALVKLTHLLGTGRIDEFKAILEELKTEIVDEDVYLFFERLLSLERMDFANVLIGPNKPPLPKYMVDTNLFSLGVLVRYEEVIHAHLYGNSTVEVYEDTGECESSSLDGHDPLWDLTCFEQLGNGPTIDEFSRVTGVRPIFRNSVPYVEFPPDQSRKGLPRKFIIAGKGVEFWKGYDETGGYVDANMLPKDDIEPIVSTNSETLPQFDRTLLALPDNGIVILSTPPLSSFLNEEERKELIRECCRIKKEALEGTNPDASIAKYIEGYLKSTDQQPRRVHRLNQDLALTFIAL